MCPSKWFTKVGPPGKWDTCYYKHMHDQGYSHSEVIMTMEEGRQLCSKLGAHLLVIDSKLERMFVKVRDVTKNCYRDCVSLVFSRMG